MFNASCALFLYSETAVHAGKGTDLGVVDLPIQRERITHYPMIQPTSVKGALRSACRIKNGGETKDSIAVFGPDVDGSTHGGAISPGEARLLLFPVRSLSGTFVWITCRVVLARFLRDMNKAGLSSLFPEEIPDVLGKNEAWVSDKNVLLDDSTPPKDNIVLEEFSFTAGSNDATKEWAEKLAENALPSMLPGDFWKKRLKSQLVVLHDDAFQDFVNYSTEIVTRIKIDAETKTVVEGALFTQELLPADSLLYSVIYANQPRTKTHSFDHTSQAVISWMKKTTPNWLQIGGDETVGRGIMNLRWVGGGT